MDKPDETQPRMREFSPEDTARMREEMLTQFAPATPMPAERTVPSHRVTLVDGDELL